MNISYRVHPYKSMEILFADPHCKYAYYKRGCQLALWLVAGGLERERVEAAPNVDMIWVCELSIIYMTVVIYKTTNTGNIIVMILP